jgi:hypothetical protein
MVEEQHEPATRSQHARHLRDCALHVVNVLEHERHDRGVERRVTQWKRERVGAQVARATGPRPRDLQLRVAGIDTDDVVA